MTTTVRLPDRVEQALAAYCVETHRSKSEVIVELLEQRLGATVAEATPFERALAAGFIGCIDTEVATTDHTDTYKSRAKAAIRAKHNRA